MGFTEGNQGFLFKIVIIGDGGVGKTALLERYLGGEFLKKYQATIGAEIAVHTMDIDGRPIKYQIWDLAGQERFEFIRPIFYKGSHAAVMVFDRTRLDSLGKLWSWMKELITNVGRWIPIIVLGNKSDLQEKINIDRKIINNFMKEVGTEFPNLDIPVLLTSAYSGLNVTEAFEVLGRLIRRYYPEEKYQRIVATQKAG
jgi:small GTP-binding protein